MTSPFFPKKSYEQLWKEDVVKEIQGDLEGFKKPIENLISAVLSGTGDAGEVNRPGFPGGSFI